MATKTVKNIYEPTQVNLSYYSYDVSNLIGSKIASKAAYTNMFITKRYQEMTGRELRRRMNQDIPKKQIAGKVRIRDRRFDLRIWCADWETTEIVIEFLRGL